MGGELRPLDRDLWVIDHPFRLMGLPLGTRTTVVRLSDGGLFLHSPGPPASTPRVELEKLGTVRAIVAPNQVHHFFVKAHAEMFPGARIYAAPGLPHKIKGVRFDEELSDEAPAAWAADLQQIAVGGAPRLNEVVFFHPRSRTLVLTDLAFNVRNSPSLLMRTFMRMNGCYDRLGPTRILRREIVDARALRASLDRILVWDFDRVIVTHGDVMDRGGRDALRKSYEWL